MITEKYYFLEKNSININTKYPTLWDGYLTYERKNSEYIEWLDLDTILVDICDINFYIHTDDKNIYLSIDRDEAYYVDQFEKHIKKVIKRAEEMLNITIISGEFNATEVKHNSCLYKYIISRNKDRIILRKKVLGWENVGLRAEDDVSSKISKLKLDDDK
jgi:hypothetical protein